MADDSMIAMMHGRSTVENGPLDSRKWENGAILA
jgi:hypothetical protein